MDNFGQRLKTERERLGLTQKELAEAVSISYVTQSNYETGKRKPDTKYIASIATIGFDLKYLFTDTREENSPLAPEERVVLQCYREASPAIRKAALAVLVSGGTGSGGQNVMVNGNVTGGVVAHTIKGSGE